MLSRLALILLVAACGSCMKMQETVERTVMVRTTGSDLQPAATGYIYKKKNDGPESVVEMGESEVMEHLAKLYDQPKAFDAPIPVAKERVHIKEDENNAESRSEERIIPVKEKHETNVDGIADVDYKKIFDDYTPHYGDNTAYDDYIRKIGFFDDDYKGNAKRDNDGYNGFKKNHQFGNGDANNFHNEKYESYSYKKAHDGTKHHEQNADDHDKKADHDKEGNTYGFHKNFDNSGHGFYVNDGDKVGSHDYSDGLKYRGAESREYINDSREHNDSGEQVNHESRVSDNYDRSRHHNKAPEQQHRAPHSSAERGTADEKHGEYVAESRPAGQSYRYEIKH